jgi:hypothetical protein
MKEYMESNGKISTEYYSSQNLRENRELQAQASLTLQN